jgi:hypothetical protein
LQAVNIFHGDGGVDQRRPHRGGAAQRCAGSGPPPESGQAERRQPSDTMKTA